MSALDGQPVLVHRIRHIDSIQIRNLTPFPARDALTTALAQPAPAQPSGGPKQAAADDIELTISRRKRRISTASTGTLRSVFSADGGDDARPRLGHRASSSASSKKALVQPSPAPPKSALPSVLVDGDSSQRGLEKVIASRLLETFVTFSAPSHPEPLSPVLPLSPVRAAARDRAQSVKRGAAASTPSRRGASISSISSVASRPTVKTDGLASRTATKTTLKSPTQAARRVPLPVSPPPTPRNSMIMPSLPSSSSSMPPRPPDEPFFKSPVHRPSTNPSFDVSDAKPAFVDLSSSKLVITLWGRTVLDPEASSTIKSHRKGKARAASPPPLNEWKVLCEYDLDLNDLRPLPAEYTTHPSRLPSNTLLVHLTPPDQTFYLPERSSRPSSPDVEQPASDGELDTIRGSPKRQRRKSTPSQPPPAKTRVTATWHDLHKLVHLQSTLADTRQNLDKIVANCDALLAADTSQPAKREVSEREERLRTLREQRDTVRAQCRKTEATIESRRKELEERRRMLSSAREILLDESSDFEATATLIADQQQRRAELNKTTETQRAELLQTLSTVYPIEPLSAPDLLFTIVGVALPVPQNNTDPAPPLSLTLPDVEVEVNEETIAAALGYTAQLVQLMARYLGRRLMYPITCIGSRSLIKDPISAMMGPRMFPLYPKGVETYRFEYAVFLLNKDIELIMMDRNLRALDLRHTLPNLMNLLLTLTGPDAEPPHKHRRRPVSPQLSVKELHPPARQPSEAEVIHDLPADPQPQSTPALERRSMFSPLAAMLRARYPSSAARVSEAPSSAPASTVTADGNAAQAVPDTPKPAAEEPVANGNADGKSSVPTSPSPPPPPPPPTPAARTTSRMGGMFGRFMGGGGGGGGAEKAKPATVEAEAVASPQPTPAAVSG